MEHSGHHLHLVCPSWPMNLLFSSDGRNSLCNIVSSSRQILAVWIIAVSSNHSLKSSLPRNQTVLLHTTSQMLWDIGLIRKDIVINIIPTTPPWLLARPVVNLGLHCYDKSSTSPELFKSKFLEIRHSFREYYELCTDGSKDGIRVFSAAVSKDITKTSRLADRVSIFTAELYAIVLAYGLVYQKPYKQFIVFSDSLSALQAIKNFDVDNHLVVHIVGEHSRLEKSGKHVELCWIPSHLGITGNEKADDAAKAVLNQQITFSKLPATDFCRRSSQHCSSEWQVLGTPAHQTIYMQLFQCWLQCNEEKFESWFLSNEWSTAWTHQAYSFTSSKVNHHQFALYVKTPLTIQHFILDCPQF